MPPKKPTTKPAAKKPAAPAAKGGAKPAAAKPAAAAAPAKPKPEPLPEVEIGLKEINVAITDSEGKVKASGRWPLLIDEAERVPVFIRHRDFNNLNAIDPNDMQPEKIRLGLLGAMRYNKPFTMNLGESGSLDIIVDRFNEVLPGLLDMVLDKSILQEENFRKLIKDSDGTEYTQIWGLGDQFIVVFVSSNPAPTEETKGRLLVFRVQ